MQSAAISSMKSDLIFDSILFDLMRTILKATPTSSLESKVRFITTWHSELALLGENHRALKGESLRQVLALKARSFELTTLLKRTLRLPAVQGIRLTCGCRFDS